LKTFSIKNSYFSLQKKIPEKVEKYSRSYLPERVPSRHSFSTKQISIIKKKQRKMCFVVILLTRSQVWYMECRFNDVGMLEWQKWNSQWADSDWVWAWNEILLMSSTLKYKFRNCTFQFEYFIKNAKEILLFH
jgi:hypothetical protein